MLCCPRETSEVFPLSWLYPRWLGALRSRYAPSSLHLNDLSFMVRPRWGRGSTLSGQAIPI